MKLSEFKSAIREMIISELTEADKLYKEKKGVDPQGQLPNLAVFSDEQGQSPAVRAKYEKVTEDESLMEMAKIVGDLKVAIEKVIEKNKDAEMTDLRKAVRSDDDVQAALAKDPKGSALQQTQLDRFILKTKGELIPQKRGRKADPNKPAKEPKEKKAKEPKTSVASKKKEPKVKTFSMGDKRYYAGGEDEEGPSNLELRKLAKSGGKVEKGKVAQLRAQEKAKMVKTWLKDMRDKGIVDDANRILDKERYADEWSKAKIEIEDKVSKLS